MPVVARHLVLDTPIVPPVPRRLRARRRRDGLLLGRRAPLLEGAGRATRPPSATPAASRPTRPTRRRARAAQATPRPCSPSSTRRRRATRRCCAIFWEGHDPTQGMRQGNDVGTQYRSAIYWHDERQRDAALASRDMFQAELDRAGLRAASPPRSRRPGPFYYAEPYHQQYLAANPNGYCGLGGTGVACPIGTGVSTPEPLNARSRPTRRRPSPLARRPSVEPGELPRRASRCDVHRDDRDDDHEQRDHVDDRQLIGRARFAKIQIGSVCSPPAVKIVTTTSSKESPNARRPPARIAVPRAGT